MSDFKKNHFTPKGLLQWAYLFGTDSEGKYADDKYKVTLRLYGDEAKKMEEFFEGLKAEGTEILMDEKDMPKDEELFMPCKPALDKDKKEIPGAIEIVFKTKNKPTVVDGLKNKLTKADVPGYKDGMPIGEGVVCFRPFTWAMTDRKGNTDYGISGGYLQAVQIQELGAGGVDLDGFEDYHDGFVADTDAPEDNDEGEEDDMPSFASK